MGTLGGAALKRALMTIAILLVGAAVGGGAARIAESTLVSDLAIDAGSLDRLSSLSESAALMQAAVNQTILLAGTERPAALARAEADAAVTSFETALAALPDDASVIESGRSMIAQVENALRDLDAGRPVGEFGAATPALEASYEVFADLVSERRRSARARLAASADDAGAVTVALTAMVVFLAPAAIVSVVVWWIRRRSAEPARSAAVTEMLASPPRPSAPSMASPLERTRPRVEGALPSTAVASPPAAAVGRQRDVARHLVTLDRIRTGTLSLVSGRIDLAPIAGRVAGKVPDYDGLVDVLTQRVEVEADPLRVDDILTLLLSASLESGARKLAIVIEADSGRGKVSVAGAGAELSREALEAVEHPGDSEDPIALELTVAGQLARAMDGRLVADRFDDMTVLTLELPLADR